jgi:large subunit ribosomal protein L5
MVMLLDKYRNEIVPALLEKLGFENKLQAPRLEKIVINAGLGKAMQDSKILDEAVSQIALIAGQMPVITKAKKSVAGFKLRQGAKIGCMVTLRGNRMYEFLERFVNVVLPRIRDFRGVSPSAFDGRGNYTLGIKEQSIFPEISYDKIVNVIGMAVTFVTTTEDDNEARELLRLLGMPFRGRPQTEETGKKKTEIGQESVV